MVCSQKLRALPWGGYVIFADVSDELLRIRYNERPGYRIVNPIQPENWQ
jgi:hypothetical protein